MRQTILIFLLLNMTYTAKSQNQPKFLDPQKVQRFTNLLDDVMELTDTNLVKQLLTKVESTYKIEPSEINKVKLGIIYHETALNLTFLNASQYKGYASKSYNVLSEMFNADTTTPELMPLISSYRASALSLMGAETKKLGLLFKAFPLFEEAVTKYSSVSPYPEFLRGSVAENLPSVFFWLTKFAKRDFQSIISKYDENSNYANSKIMSFTYWAWAKSHQRKRYQKQAIIYLDKSIELDPNYQAGRKKAEELKHELTQ